MTMNEIDREVVLSYARNNMNRSAAGRETFCSRTTADYHVKRVKKITGLDPREFLDLIKLVRIIIREEPVLDEKDREFCARFILAVEGEV